MASAGRDHSVQIYDRYAHTHQPFFAAKAVAHAVATQRTPATLHDMLRSEVKLPSHRGLVYTIVTHVTQPLNPKSCNCPPIFLLCRAQGRKVGELTGHTKRVTDAKFLGHQDLMVTTSADKTSRLWAVDGDAYKCKVSC